MAGQFGVFRNPGTNKAIPFVVVVQSNRFRKSARCVVVPLVKADIFRAPESDIGPRFIVEGEQVILDPLQITNVPANRLGAELASLADHDERITYAIDVMLSRACR